MSVLYSLIAVLAIFACPRIVLAQQWVQSNPDGSFAMGFVDGYINNGDYEVVIPKGSDEVKRDVLIGGPGVRDKVDMVFNANTMVFSNWDGWFKLGNAVYTDEPGVLYFMQRSDGRCQKKIYMKLGEDIRPIDSDIVDVSVCQALKAKIDSKAEHFLQYPFKYMLPEPNIKLKMARGFPGGEYYTQKVYGTVNVCQFTVNIPLGDPDKEKEILITAPGIYDSVTMKVNSHTQIYGKWDGYFYIGDKVYSDKPRVLYIDDEKGGCLKKVFEDHETTITIAYTKMLTPKECFIVKSKVFDEMQKLIANPKLLPGDKPSPPITVTSTVVYPGQSDGSQSTHTITVAPGASGSTTNVVAQPPLTSSTPGVTHVHTSSVTSDHPDYPSVSATSVMQSPSPQGQPQSILINQGQVSSPGVTLVQPAVLIPGSNPPGTLILQPANPQPVSVQLAPVPPVVTPALNLNSQNVNIQPDGSLLVDGKSTIVQGIEPNTELVTPDGSVVRVGRSVDAQNYQAVALTSQGNALPVVTLSGNSETQGGSLQTTLTVPANSAASPIQHTTMVKVPGNVIQPTSTNLYLLQPQTPIPKSPMLLKLVQSTATVGTPVPATIQLNGGGAGSAILINTQNNKQQIVNTVSSVTVKNPEIKKDESLLNVVKNLNLPVPVNNLIVNIAENTNFHKKK